MQPTIVAKLVAAIMEAPRTSELLAVMDAYQRPTSNTTPVSFGVEKRDGRSIDRERREANAAALAVLARVGDNASLLTEEDKATLRKYTGEGGIGGSQDEYYTPQPVAEGIWDAMAAMGMGPGNYVEPSCGVGVFNGTKPKGAIISGAELSETSSRINQLLHPEDMIRTGPFEDLAVNTEDNTWDGAIGNVPFASNRSGLADRDPEYRDIDYVDQYFVTRLIDKIRPGGLMCVVVPTRIIERAAWKKWRETLSLKAEFLGAHRLPSGTFDKNGTETVTDVLVMRKHPEELAALISERDKKTLKAANVIWDTWTTGKWFASPEGKRFIHGEQSRASFQNRLQVDAGAITQSDIKAKLAHKFESRIDWMALEMVEPQIRTWAEGDERLINGRWRRLINGQWQEVSRTAADGNTIDKSVYGVDNLTILARTLSSQISTLSLTYEQLLAARRDFPSLFDDNRQLKQAMAMADGVPEKHRERVLRGVLIGISAQSLASLLISDGRYPAEEAAIVRQLVQAEIARFGVAAADPELTALRHGPVASAWQSFVQSTDATGKLSDLLTGNVDRGNAIAFDNTSAEQTVAYLFGVKDLNPVELGDFAELYKGSTPVTLSDLAKVDGIAITPDGMLSPMDRATSGNIVATVDGLKKAMADTTDQSILDNFQRQLEAIEAKRVRNKIDDIEITMSGKWLPRRYVLEFLKDKGYIHFEYGRIGVDDSGYQFIDTEYDGEEGIFWGYELRNAHDTKKEGQLAKNKRSAFEAQLEHYLNGDIVSGGKLENTAAHMERINALEEEFGLWIRKHDEADAVLNKYNDTFHGYIAPTHSDSNLAIPGVAGEIIAFGYQNEAVRRLSEDGRGLLGFGTGLGKTTTALLLAAYNIEMGRSKRTCFVVPKSVLENWYHEALAVYGREYLNNCFFPGLEVVVGKSGEIETVPVLDDNGQPKLGRNGEPLFRDKIKLVDSATLTARMNQIPHTSKRIVILTKEQFAELPLRPDSVVAHVDEMLAVGLRSGLLEAEATSHREAAKKANFMDKHSDTGTEKKSEYPYYEDCGFDSVIVDEAHNYRNTYEVNRQSASLAHLPKPRSSQVAMDMQVKMSWLQRNNNGRGPVMLTATPTANSPCDIFNMLNHIMRPDEWAQYGIADINDFIKTFGETETVEVQKLTGAIEYRQGLVGFKNLSGLRSLFHRHCNLKSALDVSADVTIPDLEESQVDVDMTPEQAGLYEELRARAEAISNPDPNDETPPESVFSVIADMERVTTDLDLYHKTMTYLIPASEHDKVKALIADLPESIKTKVNASATSDDDSEDYAGDGKTVEVVTLPNTKLSKEGDTLRLIVSDAYEPEVTSRLKKFNIDTQQVTHPMTPKYARLVENVRSAYEEGGKQIIFAEDKRQHQKLRRILAHHLGIPSSEIGIINADTVSGKSDFVDEKGKKVKDVEPLAAAYNEGRFRILICNKKAEVGVNLHHGTTDIHHLTLPWTPASIKQRNGRGARVGSSQRKVRAHYYMGRGSFDEHRLATLKRKAEWQHEILQPGGAERASNANVADAAEVGLLLAKDPDERRRKIEAAQQEARNRIAVQAKKRANIDLHNYIKACHDMVANRSTLEAEATSTGNRLTTLQAEVEKLRQQISQNEENLKLSPHDRWWQRELRDNKSSLNNKLETIPAARQAANVASKRLERLNSADSMRRRLRGEVERAIKNGVINVPMDVLDHGDQFLTDGVNTIRKGHRYNYIGGAVVEVKELRFDTKVAVCTLLYKPGAHSFELDKEIFCSVESMRGEASYTPDEVTLLRKLLSSIPIGEVAALLSEAQFTHYLTDGTLKLSSDNTYLLRTESGFESVSAYTALTPEQAKRAVYPAPSAGEKTKLAKWLLENRKYLDSYYAPGEYLTAIYGKSYVDTVEGYGKTAPAQVISAWVAEKRKAFDLTDESKTEWAKAADPGASEYSSSWSRAFTRTAEKEIPAEWDNKAAFEKALDEHKEAMNREWAAEIKAQKARRGEEIAARYTLAVSQVSDEGRAERLTYLKTMMAITNPANLYAKTDLSNECPYADGGKFDVYKALADMAAIEIYGAGALASAGNTATDASVKRAFEMAASSLTVRYSNPLDRWIAEQKAKETPVPPPAPAPTPEKVERATATVQNATVSEAEINGVKVRPALGELSLRGKYNRVTTLPGSWLGLHDPAGIGGPLHSAKETLKSRYGAKYAKNGNEQFPDSWWFVPASTPMNELTALLGANA